MNQKKLYWHDRQACTVVIEALKQGNVVAGTTDTVLGLLADTTREGFGRLDQIKGRVHKPYLILIGAPNNVRHFVSFPLADSVQRIIDACWPGPLTIIFKAKPGLPPHLVALDGTIALRMPDHAGLLAILEYFNGLYSTSANFAGEPVAATVDQLDPRILASVAHLIVDDEQSDSIKKSSSMDLPASLPSTIIDCTGDEVVIVREGAFTRAMLSNILE